VERKICLENGKRADETLERRGWEETVEENKTCSDRK
jgi:hypothetical protein